MKEKKKVGIFSLYCIEGASSNFRILMYVKDLRKKYEVKEYHFWKKSYVEKYMSQKKRYICNILFGFACNTIQRSLQLLFIAPKYDVIIIQKAIIPKIPLLFIDFLKKKGCKIVFDVDDAVYLEKRDYSDLIAAKVDCVVVGNKTLKEHYSKYNNRVYIFSTVDYSPQYSNLIHNTFDNKCIGWIGSKSTLENLSLVTQAINEVMRRHPEVKFKFISNMPGNFVNSINNSEFVSWSLNSYIRNMAEFTVGIMPLYDTPYNRGKCGFKLIQYMNLSIPVIASDVGINSEIVGNCGITVSSQEEWITALEKMLYDEDFYKKCITNMKTEFEPRYSYAVALSRWIDLINSLLE